MCINLSYCLVCPLFLLQDTRLCHGASKAPRTICICVVLRISCAYLLFVCVLKSANIASNMSAPYASEKTLKMGLKDLKLFPMEQNSVPKIQGRTNTRH